MDANKINSLDLFLDGLPGVRGRLYRARIAAYRTCVKRFIN
tara:strand:- start:282 stop:404 length:123 start_codon:yes stop_codon:yes gene_type:complete